MKATRLNMAKSLLNAVVKPAARLGFWLASTSFVLAVAGSPTFAETLALVVPPKEKTAGEHMLFFPQALELALVKTAERDGPFALSYYPHPLNSARALSKLKSGEVDVIWTMTNSERERDFIPVRISLLRGLSSHRVLLIRGQDQQKFADIKNLDQLRGFTAGVGVLWPDTDVLRINDLPVSTASSYDLLFNMLAGKRFDYIPRGLYEVWDEYAIHKDKGLVIEQNLMLYYKGPNYFFVNRNAPALADRIDRGLRLAIEDGSLDALFMSFSSFRQGMAVMENPNRKLFQLKTPAEVAEIKLDLTH